jgi:hypothetical protein
MARHLRGARRRLTYRSPRVSPSGAVVDAHEVDGGVLGHGPGFYRHLPCSRPSGGPPEGGGLKLPGRSAEPEGHNRLALGGEGPRPSASNRCIPEAPAVAGRVTSTERDGRDPRGAGPRGSRRWSPSSGPRSAPMASTKRTRTARTTTDLASHPEVARRAASCSLAGKAGARSPSFPRPPAAGEAAYGGGRSRRRSRSDAILGRRDHRSWVVRCPENGGRPRSAPAGGRPSPRRGGGRVRCGAPRGRPRRCRRRWRRGRRPGRPGSGDSPSRWARS